MEAKNIEYTGDEELEIMSKYAINRNNSVDSLIKTAFQLDSLKSPKKILEFGAGKGEFINRYIDNPFLDTYVVELDELYLNNLKINHKAYRDIEEINDQSLDFIFLIDVLEHIEDDRRFLKLFHNKLKVGGKLFIYVPARMELFSHFDEKVGHFRRYHKNGLGEKVTNAGFQIMNLKYHELLGYMAAYYNKFSKSGNLNAKAVNIYDKFLVPPTNLLEKFVKIPIGKSLYLSAKK